MPPKKPQKNVRHRIKTRGHRVGHCAICGSEGRLTDDHVPPRGCGNLGSYALRPLAHDDQENSARFTQGGIKFKTICAACNNDRLGARYDKDLIALASELCRYLDLAGHGIRLPAALKISANPHRIARAVVGHVLAPASVQRTPKPPADFPMEATLREFFLDPAARVPPRWKFHYWVYSSAENVVAKYFSRLDTSIRRVAFGHCLKFYPLGFFLSWKPEAQVLSDGRAWDENAHLGELFDGGPFGPEDLTELEFWPDQDVHVGFPERPCGRWLQLIRQA